MRGLPEFTHEAGLDKHWSGGDAFMRGRAASTVTTRTNQRSLLSLQRLLTHRESALLLVIAVLGFITWSIEPRFLTYSNLRAVFIGASVDIVVAVGMMILMVAGGFDLSVGGVIAISGIAAGWLLVSGVPLILGIVGGMLTGALFGLINGVLVTKGGVNALVTTLGTMTVTRSLALVQTEGYPIVNLPPEFSFLGQGELGPLPVLVGVAFLLVVLGEFGTRWTRILRQAYYVGGNIDAAKLSGMRVDRIRLSLFVLTGLLAGLAGVMTASRLMTAVPTAGTGVELRVITACVIGGASLAGGEGSIIGAVLGVLLMSVVTNAMTLTNISPYWHGTVIGVILIIAVMFDYWTRHRRVGT